MNIADVSARVSCRLNSDGSAGKGWPCKLKMVHIRVPCEGRIEAKAEPSASA
jgi:hypothetical protein